MANIPFIDANGDTRYLSADGAGTSGDPHVVQHEIEQAAHDDLNANANLQVGDADVGMSNPVPVKFGTSISLPAGTNNIGDVDLASALPAGEYHIGQVSGHAEIIEITLTLDTGGAYADGDVLADTQAMAGAARVNDGKYKIVSLQVLDEDDQGVAMRIVFLDANVSLGTENAAVAITDENARNILGSVLIDTGDYVDLGNSQIATKMEKDLGLLCKPASGGTTGYVAVISKGAGTYTASGVRLRIGVEQY
ncbi:MAG: hypothetical protein JW910_21885 [Anaerolineae bacterium]|nr:hypothetical protein [Anaerolineae bacterium]